MENIPSWMIFFGILATFAILIVTIKRYEGRFKEKNMFLSLVAGLGAGFVAFVLEWFTINVGFLYIILFPAVEQILKLMIINVRPLQEKKETPIYGLTVGLGFGAILMPLSVIMASSSIKSEVLLTSLALFFGTGLLLFHGATGCILGYGISSTDPVKKWIAFTISVLLQIPIMIMYFLNEMYYRSLSIYIYSIILIYGLVIYWYTISKILPKILTTRRKRSRISP